MSSFVRQLQGTDAAVPVTLSNVNISADGHLETFIHGPRSAFGNVLVDLLTPVIQFDAVYGQNAYSTRRTESGSGTVTTERNAFLLDTGATINSQAVLQSRDRGRYRPGQGLNCMFTASFQGAVANAIQVAGVGHGEDGLFVGTLNGEFALLYSHHGLREVRTLTVNTASSTAENVTVTLNGVPSSVAVTNSGNVQRTVWELSQGVYSGWQAEAVGNTVVFLRGANGPASSGSYSLTASTAAGNFAQTRAGALSTEEWIMQPDFNMDKLDGTDPAGFVLDKTKLNVFRIQIAYLGGGPILFSVLVPGQNNDSNWVAFHQLNIPNTLSAGTSLSNPSFPFTAASYSAGSTSSVQTRVGSVAIFTEGERMATGVSSCFERSVTGTITTSLFPIFTIHFPLMSDLGANQGVVRVFRVSVVLDHNFIGELFVVRSVTGATPALDNKIVLVGNPNFQRFQPNGLTLWDTAATGLTVSDNSQIVWSGALPKGGTELAYTFEGPRELVLQPGEYLSLCARTVSGTASYTVGSMIIKEDV